MSDRTDVLFRPFASANLSLPNRIVMAPMTREMSPGAIPREANAAYYARRAAGGVGLILSEGTTINHPTAAANANIPQFHGDAALAGWKGVIEAVHAAGGRMGPQLWHEGMMRRQDKAPDPTVESAGPSGLKMPGKPFSAPLTDAAIADLIEAYAQGAADAQALGFDCAELHGAHGYLIDQFFWSGTNERTDKWGGATLADRTRFACDAIRAARAKVGADFPLLIRFSQWKQQDFDARLAETPDELAAFLEPLVDAGIDIFHCSQRRFWDAEFDDSDLNLAGWTKKLTGKPTISVGSVGLSGEFVAAFQGESSRPASLDQLIDRMERDEFDLIAVGRAILNDAEWVAKVRDGRHDEMRDFTKDALMSLS